MKPCSFRLAVCVAALVSLAVLPAAADAAEWFVAPGGSGPGTSTAPFGRIQDAIDAARPGDVVTIRPGTYSESLRTVRHGVKGSPIHVRAAGNRGSVLVTVPARVLRVDHAYHVFEGLVIDAQYAQADAIDVNDGATGLVLRNLEVRRSTRDLIDIAGPEGVVIDNCLIHHALNAANGRTDAHGIVAGAARNLTIRNTEIHTFSGDAFQIDPGRHVPGWDNVLIENVRMWLEPLPKPENGFPAGTVPGENAVDTKSAADASRARLTIRNATAWGFRNGLISNMAAFNLKENIEAILDGITVHSSEIAFRTRGSSSSKTIGARVTVANAVVYDVQTAYRYEDDIEQLRVWNNTFGRDVGRAFQAASSNRNGLDVRNLLVLGTLPAEASDPSNLGVQADVFVNAASHDYRLAQGTLPIDAGTSISAVKTDRDGVTRPQGARFDVGAFERQQQQQQPPPPQQGGPVPSGEIVLHTVSVMEMSGHWSFVADPTAASGARLTHPDFGQTIARAEAAPRHYFELEANVQAGRPYRLWIRGRAEGDAPQNDSVYVQFSGSVAKNGKSMYRIGSRSALVVELEDCAGCGLSGWGWQDNGQGVNVLGPVVYFAEDGPERIRIQTREDGISIDQVVLSPEAYPTASPGAVKNDTTILLPR